MATATATKKKPAAKTAKKPKAASPKAAKKGKPETNGFKPVAQLPPTGKKMPIGFAEIELGRLAASSTNPRKVFHPTPLDELAGSIQRNGIIEPLVVRQLRGNGKDLSWGNFEIVAGERRYRASHVAGYESTTKVPVIVKELTDEQVFDIQFDENLHRADLEPMDEARAFKFYRDSCNITIDELAARLNKNVRFVHQRLKLTDLLPEFQQAMDEGFFPVTYGYLIARYTEDKQKVILREAFRGKVSAGNMPDYRSLTWAIERHVEMKLSEAPFDLNDDRLRKDGLKCVDCPQRAGANPTLFEKVKPSEDRCLDSTCFKNKERAFIQIARDDLTAKGRKKYGDKYVAPVTLYYESREGRSKYPDALRDSEYKAYDTWDRDTKAKCSGKETAISFDYSDRIKLKEICRDKSCPMHWKKARGKSEKPADRGSRKEEIFDAKAREEVRKQVLLEAAPKFAESLAVDSSDPGFYVDLVARALEKFDSDESIGYKLVDPYLKSIGKSEPPGLYNRSARVKWLSENLKPVEMAAMLFLLVKGVQGAMGYGDRYVSQDEIMAIAKRYEINYRLYDAEQRLAFCRNKKQRVGLEAYHEKVKAGEVAEIPRFWKPDYVAPDVAEEPDMDEE